MFSRLIQHFIQGNSAGYYCVEVHAALPGNH